MSQENFSNNISNTPNTNTDKPKSQDKLEAKFGVPKFVGAVALSMAALAGGNVEARTTTIKVDTPQIQALKADLNKMGVTQFVIVQGLRLSIQTDKGNVYIGGIGNNTGSPVDRVSSALQGVSGQQLVNEIKRQNSRERGVDSSVEAPHGTVKINISPYAMEVFKEYNVKYDDGVISKGTDKIDLTAKGTDTPNTECTITGSEKEFVSSVIANCKEMRVVSGKPSIYRVSYQIDVNNLTVREIGR